MSDIIYQTDLQQEARDNYLLYMAYKLGEQNGFDELEILKRFILVLLRLKDDALQEKIDNLMTSNKPLFRVADSI